MKININNKLKMSNKKKIINNHLVVKMLLTYRRVGLNDNLSLTRFSAQSAWWTTNAKENGEKAKLLSCLDDSLPFFQVLAIFVIIEPTSCLVAYSYMIIIYSKVFLNNYNFLLF